MVSITIRIPRIVQSRTSAQWPCLSFRRRVGVDVNPSNAADHTAHVHPLMFAKRVRVFSNKNGVSQRSPRCRTFSNCFVNEN
jgi:hypothetical protein